MKDNYQNEVLIVDDHPMIQMGVSSVLRRSGIFDNINVASSGKEAVEHIKNRINSELSPLRLIIADIQLPDYEIMNLIHIFITKSPKTPILILSMAPAKLYLENLVNAGVKGFLNKGTPEEELIFAIKKILAGHTFFGGDLVKEMVTSNVVSYNWARQLSPRENEILGLLLKGISSKEICQIVNLHKSSVATYKARIYQKLGVSNSMEFFQWASREKLIQSL
tara:strand:- start:119 stop:784 length:666 start_codon:yes stop_codon:yes gene_type:complete